MKRWGIVPLAALLLAAGGFGVWWKATADDRAVQRQRDARFTVCMALAESAPDYSTAVADCLVRFG